MKKFLLIILTTAAITTFKTSYTMEENKNTLTSGSSLLKTCTIDKNSGLRFMISWGILKTSKQLYNYIDDTSFIKKFVKQGKKTLYHTEQSILGSHFISDTIAKTPKVLQFISTQTTDISIAALLTKASYLIKK